MSDPRVSSIRQFLEAVWDIEPPKKTHVKLYRGQSETKPLLPRLFRPPEGTAPSNPDWIAQIKAAEQQLLKRFKNESPYLLPSRPDNDWDWLSLAQHFRLPTRLLDWTANPLTALFFAVECENPTAPVVYVYYAPKDQPVDQEQKQDQDPFEIGRTRILQPSWHSLRVAMQAGWHTVHRIHKLKNRPETVLPLEAMEVHKSRIKKLLIHPSAAAALRAELADMGIKHVTIYGDLQSVCDSISRGFDIACGGREESADGQRGQCRLSQKVTT